MNRFDFVRWSPLLMKILYNITYSRLALRQLKDNRDVLSEMEVLRNKYKGRRCFVIGTGPSLTVSDLELLKGEITFAPNRIYELLDKTSWRPTFYVCQDRNIIETFPDRIRTVDSELAFLPVSYKEDFKGDKYRFFVLKEREYYPGNPEFSSDVSRFVAQGYTVTYGAIQLAVHMGFSEIYLLGVDHNYNVFRDSKGRPVKKEDGGGNYPKGMKEYVNMNNLPRIEETTLAYEMAEKCSRKMGVRIYNATRGGKLEAFERVNLDKILSKI